MLSNSVCIHNRDDYRLQSVLLPLWIVWRKVQLLINHINHIYKSAENFAMKAIKVCVIDMQIRWVPNYEKFNVDSCTPMWSSANYVVTHRHAKSQSWLRILLCLIILYKLCLSSFCRCPLVFFWFPFFALSFPIFFFF